MKLRWLFWILVVGFLWFLIGQLSEIEKLFLVFLGGRWQWVLLALMLQGFYFWVFTSLYRTAFRAVKVKSRMRELLPLALASIFINVMAPSGRAGGAALFIDDAARRGESPGRAAAGTLLVLIADFTSFLIVLVAGIIFLMLHHNLESYQIAASVLLLAITGGLGTVLVLGIQRPDILQRLLNWLQQTINRIGTRLHKPGLLAEDWAQHNAAEFTGAAFAISTRPQHVVMTMLTGLLAHLVELLSLYAVVLAFYRPINPGMLIAGYAMGTLFRIIAITPQGIGAVEGIMALVYTSLGMPVETATIIALAFRGLTFWLPFMIGFLVLRRLRAFRGEGKLAGYSWSVPLVALVTAIMGLINVWSAITPNMPARFTWLVQHSPLRAVHAGRLATALSGFALLVLASELSRRKRVAWILTLFVLAISAVSHLAKGLDYEVAILALALAAWLVYLRPQFHALSDPPSIRQGLLALLAASLFTLAYGAAGFYLLDHQFKVNFGLQAAIWQTVAMFIEFNDPGLQPITGLGRYFADSIYAIALATYTYAAYMLIRPVLLRDPVSPQERRQAQSVIEKNARSVLASFALLRDKVYFFSSGGSLINFVVKGRVALVLGDPIGPAEDAGAAIQEFQGRCAHNDWQPAFYQVMPDYLEIYQSVGLQQICIGNEAIVDLHSFTLSGRENKGLRSGYNKLVRLGYQSQVVRPPHPKELIEELHQISNEWLSLVKGTEKRFSVGWFDEEYLNRCPLMIVSDPNGKRIAFTNLLMLSSKKELAIDLMRHLPGSESGLMDFLFVSLIQWACENSFETFDMGLSALSGVGEAPDASLPELALHYIYEHIQRFYNFKGLHDFKEKFHPRWESRFLIFPGVTFLPPVALALIQADSGDEGVLGYFRN